MTAAPADHSYPMNASSVQKTWTVLSKNGPNNLGLWLVDGAEVVLAGLADLRRHSVATLDWLAAAGSNPGARLERNARPELGPNSGTAGRRGGRAASGGLIVRHGAAQRVAVLLAKARAADFSLTAVRCATLGRVVYLCPGGSSLACS